MFLEKVMRKMGFFFCFVLFFFFLFFCFFVFFFFPEKWIRLIMVCVKIVTYSILVNGEPKGLIYPLRGLRQGDPLSPFLFLLCIEGLHGLIN